MKTVLLRHPESDDFGTITLQLFHWDWIKVCHGFRQLFWNPSCFNNAVAGEHFLKEKDKDISRIPLYKNKVKKLCVERMLRVNLYDHKSNKFQVWGWNIGLRVSHGTIYYCLYWTIFNVILLNPEHMRSATKAHFRFLILILCLHNTLPFFQRRNFTWSHLRVFAACSMAFSLNHITSPLVHSSCDWKVHLNGNHK